MRLARAAGKVSAAAAVLTGAEFLVFFVLLGGRAAARPAHFFLWLPCAAAALICGRKQKSC